MIITVLLSQMIIQQRLTHKEHTHIDKRIPTEGGAVRFSSSPQPPCLFVSYFCVSNANRQLGSKQELGNKTAGYKVKAW